MFFREIWRILSTFTFAFALTILLPLSVAVYYEYITSAPPETPPSTFAFLATFAIALSVSGLFKWLGRGAKGKELYRKEGLAAVVIIWIVAPMIASMPFLLSGTLDNPFQAYFESTSGLTTTGASLLTAKQFDPETGEEIPIRRTIRGDIDTEYVFYGTVAPVRYDDGSIHYEGIEAVSRPILLWRSFLQWLGGLGIIVLFVAILPALGVGGKILFHAEMPGPLKETLTPRLKETAAMLWKIYLALSAAEILMLKFTNVDMSWYDAVAVTFSTISTGGFTVNNGSIASYNSISTEWIVIVFMLIGSINFSLYFYCLRGKFYRLYEPELLTYLCILLAGGTFAAYHLHGTEKMLLTGEPYHLFNWTDSIRTGFFQIISAQTSTGFATTNYDKWPFVLQVLMLILIYIGGMSGSTAGGIKMMRHIMAFRIVQNKVELMFRPETVRSFRIGDREVSQSAALTVLCFFLTVLALAAVGTFILVIDGLDPESALTVITSIINNSGMGFREAGPTDSYAFLSNFSLAITSIWMILGRLEFFAVLVVLVPAFWRKN